MSFATPLGFLGLLLIPVLILVYIIKNRYTEQTVASTYIWNISERFLKRRTPISRLVGIISLILQILVVIMLSLALAKPSIFIKNGASDYIFVLDGSGSMNTIKEGETRFELAKRKIADMIGDSGNGSTYTLILAASSAELQYASVTDADLASASLSEIEGGDGGADIDGAIAMSYRYMTKYSEVFLLTDKEYKNSDNVTVVRMGGEADNFALKDVETVRLNDSVEVRGKVTSALNDSVRTIEFSVDGEVKNSIQVQVSPENEGTFSFNTGAAFTSLQVRIVQDDALPEDNVFESYGFGEDTAYRILLVSDSPSIFLRAALIAAGGTLNTVKADSYLDSMGTGYGLYIFDSFVPSALPRDGAVWFVDPSGSAEGALFAYQGEVQASSPAEYATSTSSKHQKLLEGVSTREFEIYKYRRCGLSGRFTTLISCDNNPLVFAGVNAFSNREVVFAFDERDAVQFTMSDSYTSLIGNLLMYSFPKAVDESNYVVGEEIGINVLAGLSSLKLTAPDGREAYFDVTADSHGYTPLSVGEYVVSAVGQDGNEHLYRFFASMPAEESAPEEVALIAVVADIGEKKAGIYDSLIALFIILILLFAADYGVYSYEQYQLR